MNQNNPIMDDRKAAMKELREHRKEFIQQTSARVSRQRKAIKAIQEELRKGDGTVPEIAEATSMPANEVLWCMAAMKKYGQIVETREDGGYFRYALVADLEQEAS